MEQPVAKTRPPRSFGWIYAVVLVLAAAMLGVGLWLALRDGNWSLVPAGAMAVILVLAVWPLALAMERARREQGQIIQHINTTLDDRLEQVSILLNLISEQQLLSDRAKAIAFREKDSDALRRAIQEEIAKCNWEVAMTLVNEIESSFGYKQEAERFRAEVNRCRLEQEQKLITEATAVIDRAIRGERWAEAQETARRLQAQFPDNEVVRNLPADIERRRTEHKQRLIDSWHDAVARKDVDGSIEILKQLDLYLTPAEAQDLQETARTVFKEKLNLLRLQFAGAVQDHRWGEAIDLGEQIMRDFPNTRIAQEVSEKMQALRERATAEPEPAKV
jgi:hypothetical protein